MEPASADTCVVQFEAIGSQELEHRKFCLPLSTDLLKYYVLDPGYKQNVVPEAFIVT